MIQHMRVLSDMLKAKLVLAPNSSGSTLSVADTSSSTHSKRVRRETGTPNKGLDSFAAESTAAAQNHHQYARRVSEGGE